ncbi:GDP-L-fucose synthase family protein [Demequina muriae]|uniref:GDP-L-fucose synthase n=1 Tax=Demequina muriae TaxID=3051664 RepID=A0ABT8GG61_9MICO|nr:GDP-L-fucose synthase [Demequina sp. EGI L300058]MDN4480434.1 GDP-L-fucose synthase [Demequina sp. EGI L300058]
MRTLTLPRDATIYIAGHRGLAGSALWRGLEARGFSSLVGVPSAEADLRDRQAARRVIEDVRPDVIFLAAARVGGIAANIAAPTDFLSENLQIQANVMDAAAAKGVPKLVFLGSSCIYPRLAPQPLREEYLMTGPLEPTNEAYAVAKIAGIMHVKAVRQQYGLKWISVMPSNLYGPGDNFHPQKSHVVPGMIRRFHEAKVNGVEEVAVWGTGRARRELLFADDFADGTLHALEHFDGSDFINVGSGEDISIADLAALVARVVGYDGTLSQDLSKPDGMPQKLLDTSRMQELGWTSSTSLEQGLRQTYEWFLSEVAAHE